MPILKGYSDESSLWFVSLFYYRSFASYFKAIWKCNARDSMLDENRAGAWKYASESDSGMEEAITGH